MNDHLVKQIPDYVKNYLAELYSEIDLDTVTAIDALGYSFSQAMDLFSIIYPEQKDYAYAEGKWTIGEVIGHLIDCERIFAYRALRISRGDKQNQRSWDENEFAQAANYADRDWESIKQEFLCCVESTGHLIEGMSEAQRNEVGRVNGYHISPELVGLFVAAHRLHHFSVIKERYLNNQ